MDSTKFKVCALCCLLFVCSAMIVKSSSNPISSKEKINLFHIKLLHTSETTRDEDYILPKVNKHKTSAKDENNSTVNTNMTQISSLAKNNDTDKSNKNMNTDSLNFDWMKNRLNISKKKLPQDDHKKELSNNNLKRSDEMLHEVNLDDILNLEEESINEDFIFEPQYNTYLNKGHDDVILDEIVAQTENGLHFINIDESNNIVMESTSATPEVNLMNYEKNLSSEDMHKFGNGTRSEEQIVYDENWLDTEDLKGVKVMDERSSKNNQLHFIQIDKPIMYDKNSEYKDNEFQNNSEDNFKKKNEENENHEKQRQTELTKDQAQSKMVDMEINRLNTIFDMI